MEAGVKHFTEDVAGSEIREFVTEGLQNVYDDELLEFDAVLDELERRYAMNE